jgi:GT2 family glycosyltransferase
MVEINPIIVIYNQKIDKSRTYTNLTKILNIHSSVLPVKRIIIVDNSDNDVFYNYNRDFISNNDDDTIIYFGYQKNLGIAKAYNAGCSFLVNENVDLEKSWVLLLDQDSSLTSELFFKFIKYTKNSDTKEIGIVIPEVVCKNKIVSPLLVGDNFYEFKKPFSNIRGVQVYRITGINSCSFVKLAVFNCLKGFDEKYPIDYLDHKTFFDSINKGFKIFVLDTVINHDLSFYNFKTVPVNRYLIYLKARINFIKEVVEYQRRERLVKVVLKDFLFLHCKRTLYNKMYRHFLEGNKLLFQFFKEN